MLSRDRYAQVRATLPQPLACQYVAQFAGLLGVMEGWQGTRAAIVDVGKLHCLVSVDPIGDGMVEEHVSISRRDCRVPGWADLMLIRSLAWPDDVEVHQVFPPGDEEWVSVDGVEVLHLRRQRPACVQVAP